MGTDTNTGAATYNDLVRIIESFDDAIKKVGKKYYQKGYRAKIKKLEKK